MKRFLKSTFLSLSLIFLVHCAYGGETYYIDNSPLFLYKTINWWYDSPPAESVKLCGRPIKCKNDGNAQVEYDESNKKIELKIMDGFASMLLAFKKGNQSYGPSYLRCTWFNQKYFKTGNATVMTDGSSTISGFTFSNIEKEQAGLIQSIERDLQFVLEGVIGGLSNDRIALHASGDLIKKCHGGSPDHEDGYPITLIIMNSRSNEMLAKFNMFWER